MYWCDTGGPSLTRKLDTLLRERGLLNGTPINGDGREIEEQDSADAAPVPDPVSAAILDAWQDFTPDELRTDPPPALYVWKPRIPAGRVILLNATGGSYKTTLLTNLAACRAMGRPFLDGSQPTEGETVIFSAEDNREDYMRKLAALRQEWGEAFDADRIAARFHIIAVGGLLDMRLVATEYGQCRITSLPDKLAEVI